MKEKRVVGEGLRGACLSLSAKARADGRANVVLGAVGDAASGTWELSGPASGTAIAFNATEVVPGGRIAYAGSVDFGIEQAMSDKIVLWCDASSSPIVGIEDRPKSESVSATTSGGYPGMILIFRRLL